MHLPSKLAFVDIETTGGSHTTDRIIEVGIIRVENLQVVSQFQTLIDPQASLSPFITRLTGIRQSDFESAPTFSQIRDQLLDLLNGCVFVAHNAKFDYAFLRAEFKRFGVNFRAPQLCTARLSRRIFPQHARHNLDSLIERHGLVCSHRHRAFGDAEVLWQFYQMLHGRHSEAFSDAIKHILHKPNLPPNINPELVANLPETAGVYTFFGSSELPIYIGKSKNIKYRVFSHLTSQDHTSRQLKMCQQITHIEAKPLAGELAALLLESQLVKQLQPLYNRQLRHSRQLIVITRRLNKQGYYELVTDTASELINIHPEQIVGLFRSKLQARKFLEKLVEEHSLCQKLTGLSTGSGSCFAHHLGWCKGACVKKELPLKYNFRLIEATALFKISNWPFVGPVLITESNSNFQIQTGFVVDQWCLKTATGDHAQAYTPQHHFDLDTYKILKRFILNPPSQISIKPLELKQYQEMLSQPSNTETHGDSFVSSQLSWL